MDSSLQPGFDVGEYHVLPDARLIIGPDGPHRVCEPIIALLGELATHAGHPVQRRRIIEDVWHGTPGADRALTRCISRLRRYLHDDGGRPRYIETLPGQGYRLVAEVRVQNAGASNPAAHSPSRFWSFMLELRQRKVCRAALIYAVVVWLVYQVAEVVLPALGAPSWLLASVILLGVLGFPVALVLAWTFEITSQGLQIDSLGARDPGRGESSRRELAFNAGLIGMSLLLSAQLLHAGLTRPDSEITAPGGEAFRTLVLAGFTSDATIESAFLSQALAAELRHQLRDKHGLRIVGLDSMRALQRELPREVDGLLGGSLHVDEHAVRLAVYLVDPASGQDVWSVLIEQPREPMVSLSQRLAGAIAAAIPQDPAPGQRTRSGIRGRQVVQLESVGQVRQ